MSIENIDKIDSHISYIPSFAVKDTLKIIEKKLDKCGLLFRLFGRIKSADSINKKMTTKNYSNGKKMQDLLGVRIVLYFSDDISICESLLKRMFEVVDVSKDDSSDDLFHPVRMNYVCKLPADIYKHMPEQLWVEHCIDTTMEIQIRTIFSEGWHEVEHDLRYKHKEDWDNSMDLSRNMNGLFATLETCDWAIQRILEQLAYRKYQEKDWESMLRNKLRMRFTDQPLDKRLHKIFNENGEDAKQLYRANRNEFLLFLSYDQAMSLPKDLNNIVYLLNELFIHNMEISALIPTPLKDNIESVKNILKLGLGSV